MSFIIPLFSGSAYCLVLVYIGWEVARTLLRERRIEVLSGLAPVFGMGLSVFFVNVVSFLAPGETAVFYFVLGGLFLVALLSTLCRRFHLVPGSPLVWELQRPWREIVLSLTLAITVSLGLISMRHTFDFAIMREPTAATMAEGNLPPVQIWNPSAPLEYHYAPDLLAAMTTHVAHLPLAVSYALAIAFLSGSLFLIVFLLVLEFIGGPLVALFASAGMLYLGTFSFAYLLRGFEVLITYLVRGMPVSAPFRFISDVIQTDYTAPVINTLVGQHWGAMALCLMGVVAYLYLRASSTRSARGGLIIAAVLLALLALVAEFYFVVFCAALALFPMAVWALRRDLVLAKRYAALSALIVAIAVPIALIQGGIFGVALMQQFHAPGSSAVLYTSGDAHTRLFAVGAPFRLFNGTPFYDWRVLMELGIPFLALITAGSFFLRRRHEPALFLLCISAISFILPFILRSDVFTINSLIERFFYPVMLFVGIAIGALLGMHFCKTGPLGKGIVIVLSLMLAAQGLFTHAVWSAVGYPPGSPWNPNAKFYPAVGSAEAEGYAWVKHNTALRDLFFIARENYSEYGLGSAPNGRFTLNTGRMAPIYKHLAAGLVGGEVGLDERAETSAPEKARIFTGFKKTCDPGAMKELGYRYLWVDSLWPAGLEKLCLAKNNLSLVFNAGGGSSSVRIYRIGQQ